MRAWKIFCTAAIIAFLVPLLPSQQPKSKRSSSGIRLDTTPDTYVLFLDMLEVEKQENVELVLNAAAKHPNNPVLPLGDVHEWDSLQARPWGGSLLYDAEESLFKCWYIGIDHTKDLSHLRTGYAISRDGVLWQKPRLGLYEYGGNKDNNIVHPTNDARIVKDPMEKDPARRYKMLSEQKGSVGKGGDTYFPFYSPDGIHWSPGPDVKVVDGSVNEVHQVLIDPGEQDPQKRFKFYGKNSKFPHKKPGLEKIRKIVMGYSPDFEHYRPSAFNPILDPDDGLEDEIHFASVFIYRSYYLMLYNYHRYIEYYGHGKFGNFAGDVRLAVSRDGERFRRVNPHQSVIRRGGRSEWDSGFLVMSRAVERKDGVYFYYTGSGENWASWPSDNRIVGTGRSLASYVLPSQMGLATLRADGFTHVQARDGFGPAILTTVPIQVKDPNEARLCINASELMPFRDWIEVELLDANTGAPLAGYTKQDCEEIAAEGTSLVVRWRGTGETLRAVTVPKIKLRFHLYGKASLHSFTFRSGR